MAAEMEGTTTIAVQVPPQEPFPLHAAARKGDHALLLTLLANARAHDKDKDRHHHGDHANIANTRDPEGCTPLHAAAERGHVHCIKVLLKNGASLNAKDSYGRRPIRIHIFMNITLTFW
jgi:ankyrin repeat protein